MLWLCFHLSASPLFLRVQYNMDLLVQQKIQAALQPLLAKMHSLEQQVASMALQIQTLQSENHLKLGSHLSSSIQVQTQQTHTEHRVGTDKSKIHKPAAGDKMNNKKENNGAKAPLKTEVPQTHGVKKEVKREAAKSFKAPSKETKTESHLPAEKQKKPVEQKQRQKMMKEPEQHMVQELKIEVHEPSMEKINEVSSSEEVKQKMEESTYNHTETNQMKENGQMAVEKHQDQLLPKESHKELQGQEELLIPTENKEEANMVIIPSTLTESIVQKVQNSMQPQPQMPQKQKVDMPLSTNEKEESKEGHSHQRQTQSKYQTTQVPEKTQHMQSHKKQEQKPAKTTKDQKTHSVLMSKKEPISRLKTEQNRDKINKSAIMHKQKVETKPRKDSVKDSNIKQKTVGKSVDPAMKKTKGKQDPKTEKKPVEPVKHESPLNEQDVQHEKQETPKQQETNLLGQVKGEMQA